MKLTEEQHAALGERAAAVAKGEANLAIHQKELANWTQGL
jgi:hypothetical protein